MSVTLDDLNRADDEAFVAALGDIYEHSPWVAERSLAKRPFATVAALADALAAAVAGASEVEKLALVRAHPDLAGKVALGRDSKAEQGASASTGCRPPHMLLR